MLAEVRERVRNKMKGEKEKKKEKVTRPGQPRLCAVGLRRAEEQKAKGSCPR